MHGLLRGASRSAMHGRMSSSKKPSTAPHRVEAWGIERPPSSKASGEVSASSMAFSISSCMTSVRGGGERARPPGKEKNWATGSGSGALRRATPRGRSGSGGGGGGPWGRGPPFPACPGHRADGRRGPCCGAGERPRRRQWPCPWRGKSCPETRPSRCAAAHLARRRGLGRGDRRPEARPCIRKPAPLERPSSPGPGRPRRQQTRSQARSVERGGRRHRRRRKESRSVPSARSAARAGSSPPSDPRG